MRLSPLLSHRSPPPSPRLDCHEREGHQCRLPYRHGIEQHLPSRQTDEKGKNPVAFTHAAVMIIVIAVVGRRCYGRHVVHHSLAALLCALALHSSLANLQHKNEWEYVSAHKVQARISVVS